MWPTVYRMVGDIVLYNNVVCVLGPIMIVAYGVYRMVGGLMSRPKPGFAQVSKEQCHAIFQTFL